MVNPTTLKPLFMRNINSIKNGEVWKVETYLSDTKYEYAVIIAVNPQGKRIIFCGDDFSEVNIEKHFVFSEASIGFFYNLKEFIEVNMRGEK